MEDLKMNLDMYRIQLNQIEAAISNGQNDEDLFTLREEMKELISLTEESLLSFEKSNLSSGLNNVNIQNENVVLTINQEATTSNSMDDLMTSFYTDLNSDNKFSSLTKQSDMSTLQPNYDSDSNASDNLNDEFLKTIENSEDITGTRCQAPFETEWSGKQYHNAMIMSVVKAQNDSGDTVFVKVLYLNPVLEEMKPCPYFLDEKCRFGEENCKFSHGNQVSLFKLRKFKEPDFSRFSVGSRCLAKHQAGIWHSATLLKILDDHEYEVQFAHQNGTTVLSIDDVFPILQDEDDSSDSDDIETDNEDIVVVVSDSHTDGLTTPNAKLGHWEKYTTGFGSKMLMKFGYKMGEGLGKDKKGRVEPVPVIVLPPGKSLDHCMQLKEKKFGIIDPAVGSSQPRRRHRHTVFHFLNKTLGDKKKKEDYLRKLLPRDSFGIKKEKPKSGEACKIKVEIVKNESKIKQLKEKIKRYQDSIERNKTRDPKVAKKQQAKLNEAFAELKSIQSANQAIEVHQNRAETHRKMTKF